MRKVQRHPEVEALFLEARGYRTEGLALWSGTPHQYDRALPAPNLNQQSNRVHREPLGSKSISREQALQSEKTRDYGPAHHGRPFGGAMVRDHSYLPPSQDQGQWRGLGQGVASPARYELAEGKGFYLGLPPPWNVLPTPSSNAMQEMTLIQRNGYQGSFSGNLDEYPTFRQLFIMTQHRLDVPLALKYMALSSCLRDKAKLAVKDTLPTAGGYGLLIRRLEERFGGEERHMNRQEDRLRRLRTVRNGNLSDLENLVD